MEAKNSAAAKIAADTVGSVDLPFLYRRTSGLILIEIDGQERITQDCLRRKWGK